MERFEVVRDSCREHQEVFLPEKSTSKSVGFDFRSCETVYIEPRSKHTFWMDVKVRLADDEMLLLLPRSSIGIGMNLMLANTVGIVDPDYYGNDENDGNIAICMRNYGEDTEIDRKSVV